MIDSATYWIGLTSKGKTGEWKWIDETPLAYRNFMFGYQNQLADG